MTKKQLVATVATRLKLSKKEANKVVTTVFDIITEELKKEGSVQITKFGTFEVSERPTREIVHPKSGERTEFETRKIPKFSPSRLLKNIVGGIEHLENIEDQEEIDSSQSKIDEWIENDVDKLQDE